MVNVIKKYLITWSILVGMAYIDSTFAAQKIRVNDGGTYQIRVSAREMTRIAMESPGRLEDFRGSTESLEVTPDVENGEIYIRPITNTKSFSFFVTDDNGFVYTLVATQQDVPSETVILHPVGLESSIGSSGYKSADHVKVIKDLIKAMTAAKELNGYYIEPVNQLIPVWKESSINLSLEYVGNEFVGSVYTLQNISNEKMILDEREFSSFGKRVFAIAIRKMELAPGETTSVFVVRGQIDGR